MVEIRQTTRKRQSSFYLTAMTYILVYVFSVSITGVQEVGLKINLPEEFAPSLLLVTSIFLGLRYFVDIWGDANFFKWAEAEDQKIRDINSGIEQCRNFLIIASADLTPYSRSLLTSQRPLCLPADLQNFRSQLTQTTEEGIPEDRLRENRSWVIEVCNATISDLKRKRMITYFGIANVISVFIFDIILPVVLFLCILFVWVVQPEWLIYTEL